MKLRRFVLPAASAAAAAAMLTFCAGAYGTTSFVYPVAYYDSITGTDKYGSITNYFSHETLTSAPIDITTPVESDVEPYRAGLLYTKLSASDLETIRNYGLTFSMNVNDKLSNGTDFRYRTSLDSSIIEAAGNNLPVSVDLALKMNTSYENGVTTLVLYPVSTDLGGLTLSYTIPWDSWQLLLETYGIPGNIDTYYTSDGGASYRRINSNTDAKLTFVSGTRIMVSYSKDAKYYSADNSEKFIREKIYSALGESTDSKAEHEASVTKFADDMVKTTILRVFGDTSDKTKPRIYISEKQLEKEIDNSFYDSSYLETLAEAIIGSDSCRSIIDNEIYGVFGLDSSEKIVELIREDITPAVLNKLMQTLRGTNALPSAYKDTIRYYLDGIAKEQVSALDIGIGRLVSEVGAYRGFSTAAALQELNKIKQALYASEGRVYSFGEIIELLRAGRTFNTTASTVSTGTSANYNTETVPAQLSTSDYSYGQDINAQIAALRDRIASLESEVSTLRADNSFNDWISRNYGSIDKFISAVTDEVTRKLRAEGSSATGSLSAYETAVRNGFNGTEKEWLDSLVGESAYEIAVRNGYKGTEKEWLSSLQGADGKDGKDGKDGRDGRDGKDGRDGRDAQTSASDSDRVIYVYGETRNSASPQSSTEFVPLANGKSAGDEDEIIVINGEAGTTVASNYTAGDTTTGNVNSGSSDKAAAAATVKPANPSTGAAAGLLIPAAAVASVLLIKKDKRRRGRK
ncbi:MAG: hypothetical protein J6N15_10220 [Ruminiclostridium sp.]|nr:hypothetical protein [Ruminiclostridium sp.]